MTLNIELLGILLTAATVGSLVGQDNNLAPAGHVRAQIVNPEITVIAWVNANAPDIIAAVSAGPDTAQLKSNLTRNAFSCIYQMTWWYEGKRRNLNTAKDVTYADAWLLNNSGNPAPPAQIVPDSQLAAGHFRLFNDFGNGKHLFSVGVTPIPCLGGRSAAGEASPYMGASGTSPLYQLAEGRLGKDGQIVSQTINGRSVGWIWSVIEFDSSGNPVTTNHGMFPTYYVYKRGSLINTYLQSNAATFIAQDSSYQMTPEDIE